MTTVEDIGDGYTRERGWEGNRPYSELRCNAQFIYRLIFPPTDPFKTRIDCLVEKRAQASALIVQRMNQLEQIPASAKQSAWDHALKKYNEADQKWHDLCREIDAVFEEWKVAEATTLDDLRRAKLDDLRREMYRKQGILGPRIGWRSGNEAFGEQS